MLITNWLNQLSVFPMRQDGMHYICKAMLEALLVHWCASASRHVRLNITRYNSSLEQCIKGSHHQTNSENYCIHQLRLKCTISSILAEVAMVIIPSHWRVGYFIPIKTSTV